MSEHKFAEKNPGRTASPRGLTRFCLTAALLLPLANAQALMDNQLTPFVAVGVTTDSNVFRISKDRDASTFIGSSSKSDTYRTTSVGLNLDLPLSRQRVQAGIALNQLRYSRFKDLDSTARDAKAVWLWQAGDDLNGQLGYTENSSLASFSNFSTRLPNRLTTRQAFGNASYLLNPSWRLQAGAGALRQTNDNAVRQESDINVRTADAAVFYISSAENQIGLAVKEERGSYPNRQLVAATLVDNGYTQRGVGVVSNWVLTGKSRLSARADQVKRTYSQLPQRNFSGTTLRAEYDWQITGKLALNTLALRDISSTEDIRTSFVLVKGIALRPSLELSDKLKLSATLDYSNRDYLGDPGLALGTTTRRSDRVRVLQIGIAYRPDPAITLGLSVQKEARTSNQALTDYDANMVNASARLQF